MSYDLLLEIYIFLICVEVGTIACLETAICEVFKPISQDLCSAGQREVKKSPRNPRLAFRLLVLFQIKCYWCTPLLLGEFPPTPTKFVSPTIFGSLQ